MLSPVSSTSTTNSALYPPPLQPRSHSRLQPQTPVTQQTTGTTGSTIRASKAAEAGFTLPPHPSARSNSTSSMTVFSSSEPLTYSREPGKLTAYLIPLPKPRLKGVNAADIPTRFIIYTPPPPPLSKPAPGEKESHWHKTQRKWQEDVRRATISNASAATWKGVKAKATRAIGKGVSMTKTSNLEFLDRVSDGAIASAVPAGSGTPPASPSRNSIASLDAPARNSHDRGVNSLDANGIEPPPRSPARTASAFTSCPRSAKPPKHLEALKLVYPPSLALSPDAVRAEFTASLLRTRARSQRDAVVASSLLPLAAAVDVSLILTFGGLMEVSAVWAHSSIRGARTSKRMAKGLAVGEEREREVAEGRDRAGGQEGEEEVVEVRGCTCGHHTDSFGTAAVVKKEKEKGKEKSKEKNPGIALSLALSPHVEVLRAYLEMQCLRREFAMFPQLDGISGDVTEAAALEAIGWKPVHRAEWELEFEDSKGRIERLTRAEDEAWQMREAKEDLRRLMKKGAAEWVSWCKTFQKDPEAAKKK